MLSRSEKAPGGGNWLARRTPQLALAMPVLIMAAVGLALTRDHTVFDEAQETLAANELRLELTEAFGEVVAAAESIARYYAASQSVLADELTTFVSSATIETSPLVLGQGWAPAPGAAPGDLALLARRADPAATVVDRSDLSPALLKALDALQALSPAERQTISGPALDDRGTDVPAGRLTVIAPTARASGRIDGLAFAEVDVLEMLRTVRIEDGLRILGAQIRRGDRTAELFAPTPEADADAGLRRQVDIPLADITLRLDLDWRRTPLLQYVAARETGPLVAILGGALMTVVVMTLVLRQSRLAQQAAAAALAASEQKSRFLANMSHEIRTPLNAIIGMADLVRKGPLTEKQRLETETMTRSAEALLTIINQILDFSKVSAGKLEVESVETNLAELVEDVAKAMNVLAAEKRLELVVNMPRYVPRTVMTDPLRLRQILTNLLSNAIKFTADGHVMLNIGLNRPRGAPGGPMWIRFEAQDTGIGMTEQQAAVIFEPFRQADGSTTRSFGGTGLGLSITRRFVELLGGDLKVRSAPGRGTTFTLELPCRVIPNNRFMRREMGVCAAQKILVAVAHPCIRSVLVETLDCAGAVAVGVADIEAARAAVAGEAARLDPFDIVVFQDVVASADALNALLDLAGRTGLRPKAMWLKPSSVTTAEKPASACGVDAMLEPPLIAENVARQIASAVAHRKIFELARQAEAPRAALPKGLRVLLVEDDRVNQMYALTLLDDLGCEVVQAENGAEAVEAFRAGRFDIVLMDCQMPVMDGLAAAGAIRSMIEQGQRPDTPVVALTANAVKGDRERCLAAGMCDYMTKPVREGDLVRMIGKWTRDRLRPPTEPEAQTSAGDDAPAFVFEPPTSRRNLRPEPSPADPVAAERVATVAASHAAPERGEAVADEPPTLDVAAFEASRAAMGGRFPKLLELFAADGRRSLAELPKAMEAGDFESCARAAHSVKSSARMLGGLRLAAAAQRLETAAKADAAGAAAVQEMTREFDAFLAALRLTT